MKTASFTHKIWGHHFGHPFNRKALRLGRGVSTLAITGIVSLIALPSYAQQSNNPSNGVPLGRVVSVQREPGGVRVALTSGVLRLQVFSDRIIRVFFSPTGTPSTESLSVIAKPATTGWKLTQSPTEVRLQTKAVQAHVNRATGAVSFYNAAGVPVLAEQPAGRHLVPSQVGDLQTLRSRQEFVLAPGEGIFGLGQHQQGEMNYRGHSIHLQQVNTEVAVPVLLSSRGYGVLWDNPAITDVNVGIGDEQTIPSAQLVTEDGKVGGLTGRYYSGRNFETLVGTTTDSQVDFTWTNTPPQGLPKENYSVRWTGFVQAQEAGDYTIAVSADDGMRLWIDDKQVIEDWASRPAKTLTSTVRMAANSRHRIRLEYYQEGYDATVRLLWRKPVMGSSVSWSSEAAESIDYYFMYGPEPEDVIRGYRNLTGAAPLFSKWAWGFWQSKERYQSQQELLDVAGEYRKRRIPIDGIIQDWRYWDPEPWGAHSFDPVRYPDPQKMMRDLHAENVRLLISVWAKFDPGSANEKELRNAGLLYPSTAPYYYDPFNPTGRQMYWRQMKEQIFSKGVDGWWLDASEGEFHGNWGEFRSYPTAAGPGTRVFNAYPLLHTTGVYQGQRAQTSAQRVYILTRSGYAGQQRNATMVWSGDIQGTWDVFAKQIPAGINFSLSGIPYWNTDTGGFFGGDPDDPNYRELFTRWFQFSTFCPMLRIHGTNKAKEMWRFNESTQRILANYDRLRYHLLPYIYSTSWQVTHAGSSMMRGLVMDFRQDPKGYDIPDQYLFGPSLMVCPVTQQGATSRSVYLPVGTMWTDFWTGRTYTGGQTVEAAAPIETVPLFVRGGAIIPYGPSVQSAMEKSDPTELRVYRGANGTFTLYEDDGLTYDYEKGAYATIPVSWNEAKRTLTIGARQGKFPGMLANRTFRVVVVKPGQGAGQELVSAPNKVITYTGKKISVRL